MRRRLESAGKTLLVALAAMALFAPAAAWSADDRTITAEELLSTLAEGGEVTIIDVRTIEEFEEGHIPGSISMPLAALGNGEDIPSGGMLVLYCTTGVRSGKALKALAKEGRDDVVGLEGGIRAWVDAKGNVVIGPSRAMGEYPANYEIPMGVCETKPPLRKVGE